jgi:hypothetical protein
MPFLDMIKQVVIVQTVFGTISKENNEASEWSYIVLTQPATKCLNFASSRINYELGVVLLSSFLESYRRLRKSTFQSSLWILPQPMCNMNWSPNPKHNRLQALLVVVVEGEGGRRQQQAEKKQNRLITSHL